MWYELSLIVIPVSQARMHVFKSTILVSYTRNDTLHYIFQFILSNKVSVNVVVSQASLNKGWRYSQRSRIKADVIAN